MVEPAAQPQSLREQERGRLRAAPSQREGASHLNLRVKAGPASAAPLGVSPRAGDADAEGDGLAFEPPALPHQPTPSPIEQVSPTEAVGGVIEPAAKPMG